MSARRGPPGPLDWPGPAELAALGEKYRRLAALRAERAAGAPPAPRDVLRRLAAAYPGALRELDTMPLPEIAARVDALDRAVRGGAVEPWMRYVAAFHVLMRAVLQGGRRALGAASPFPLEVLTAIASHPSRRRSDAVICVIASIYVVPEAEVASAVVPRRAAGRKG